jgi:hypothetical protein
MAFTHEDLADKSKDDLRDIAETLGITGISQDNKPTMIAKILGLYEDEPVSDKPKIKDSRKDIPLGALYTLDGKRLDRSNTPVYKLIIHSTESDSTDVDVIVNGHNLRIQRNKEVEVLEPFVQALRNAIIQTVVEDPEGNRIPSTVMKFPHTAELVSTPKAA